MNERLIASIVILIAGATFTLIRRYKNEDEDSGKAVVGWSMFSILIIWIYYFCK
jgi:hypothetical protein